MNVSIRVENKLEGLADPGSEHLLRSSSFDSRKAVNGDDSSNQSVSESNHQKTPHEDAKEFKEFRQKVKNHPYGTNNHELEPINHPKKNSVVPLHPPTKQNFNGNPSNQATSLKETAATLNPSLWGASGVEAPLRPLTDLERQRRIDELDRDLMSPIRFPIVVSPPTPPVKPKTFRDTMTWGERLLYYRCVRQLLAYRRILAAEKLHDRAMQVLQWIADTTFLLTHNSGALLTNMKACTYAQAVKETDAVEDCPETCVSLFAKNTRNELHDILVKQILEFRMRDPYNYRPTKCYLWRILPSIDYALDDDPRDIIRLGRYYMATHLDTSLGRDTSLRFLILQICVWMLITLFRAAFGSHDPDAAVPVSGGWQIAVAIVFVLAVIGIAAKCSHNRMLWKIFFRGAWLGYSVWFACATTIDDLRYLIAPLALCIIMYCLNWYKIALSECFTYLIGLVFIGITWAVHIQSERVTWKSLLLMFYLYNTWIATHLDIVLSQFLQQIFAKSSEEGQEERIVWTKLEFMNWYTFSVGLMFHFLVLLISLQVAILALVVAVAALCFVIIILRFLWALIPVCRQYKEDETGENRRQAQREADEQNRRDHEVMAETPAALAFVTPIIKFGIEVLFYIAICVMLPFKCMYASKVRGPPQERGNRLVTFESHLDQIWNELRAFLDDDTLAREIAVE